MLFCRQYNAHTFFTFVLSFYTFAITGHTELQKIMSENVNNEALEPKEPVMPATEMQSEDDNLEVSFGHEDEHSLIQPPTAAHDEEEEHADEEFHAEKLDFEELYTALRNMIADSSILKSRATFRNIRTRFQELIHDREQAALEQFLADGGNRDDFAFQLSREEKECKDKLREVEEQFGDIKRRREQEQTENYLKKQDVIQELKNLITNEQNIGLVQDKFRELQERWNQIGAVPQSKADDIWKTYRFHVDNYYQALSIHRDLFKVELQKNLAEKERIVKGVEGLLKLESIKKSLEFLQSYHKQWREIGPIPKAKSEELWQSFKQATEAVYKRRDEFFDKLNEQRRQNLESKTRLVEELEEWAKKEFPSMKDFNEAQKALDKIEQQWKAIGRVPESVSDAIWERFREARRQLVSKRQSLWHELKNNWNVNLERKMKLVEKAEELAASTEWKTTPARFKALQEEWKKIGAVQRDKSDEVWNRFRAAADAFFNAKEEHQKNVPNQELENLEKKKALLEEIKAYAHSEDMQESFRAMEEFRNTWRSIGFVPFKEKQNIEKAFEEASAEFFARINIDPAEKDKIIYKAMIDTMLASQNPYEALKNERTQLRTRIEKLRQEVSQLESNLTFFGNSKNADALKKPYEEKIERNRNTLADLDMKLIQVRVAIRPFEEKK